MPLNGTWFTETGSNPVSIQYQIDINLVSFDVGLALNGFVGPGLAYYFIYCVYDLVLRM